MPFCTLSINRFIAKIPKLLGSLVGAVCKLPLQGVAGFSVSPGLSPKIAAYVAQAKGQPASVGIYPVDRLPKDKSTDACRTNRKSFYRVSGVAFLWNR